MQLRDACYGCFLRTASLPAGPSQLISLSQCANLYLFNTTYQVCGQELAVNEKMDFCLDLFLRQFENEFCRFLWLDSGP